MKTTIDELKEAVRQAVATAMTEHGWANNRLWSTTETAAYLDNKPQTLALWRTQGRGPRYVKVGSSIKYAPPDVKNWVAGNKVGGA